MSRTAVDAEIGLIQEYAIRQWVESGSALICARCQRAYIPSRTSDPDLCGSCVPLRGLEIGDKRARRGECEHCGGPIEGWKRSDAKFCKNSCRVLAHRKKRNGDSRTTQERAVRAEDGQESARDLSVNTIAGRRVPAT